MSDVATTEIRRALNPMAKLALELGPLVIFFLVNAYADRFGFAQERRIFAATAVFLTATIVSLATHYAIVRKLPVMPMVSGIVVLVFGGLTLVLQDEVFIKLKPTIVNALFGLYPLCLVAHQQRRLRERKGDGERHDAEHLEADPHVRRLRAPDDLVEDGEEEEEHRPAERQLAPAFVGEIEHAVEHDGQERLAEVEPDQQRDAEQSVHDGRLQLDEGLVIEP